MPTIRSTPPAGRWFAVFTLALLGALPAHAGMVASDEILRDAGPKREALVDALQRDEVRTQLQAMGVQSTDARARVERLTDAEVAHLHQRIESLPAGGDLSALEVLLIVLLIVLLV